jgi:integrase
MKAAIWTIPAERMKAGKEHQVPLSKRALAILKSLPHEGAYIFPGAKAKAPLSNMAMLELLRGMRSDGLTVHGFRSSFRDWAGDRTNYAREVIEHALAHQIKDKAEASYRRSDALEKRRRLMQQWADYCAAPAIKGEVVALHGAA